VTRGRGGKKEKKIDLWGGKARGEKGLRGKRKKKRGPFPGHHHRPLSDGRKILQEKGGGEKVEKRGRRGEKEKPLWFFFVNRGKKGFCQKKKGGEKETASPGRGRRHWSLAKDARQEKKKNHGSPLPEFRGKQEKKKRPEEGKGEKRRSAVSVQLPVSSYEGKEKGEDKGKGGGKKKGKR